jgi:NCS1 family nucleobase:cation symporter-1
MNIDSDKKDVPLLSNENDGHEKRAGEDDLFPVPLEERTWDTRSYAVLWVSMIAGPSGLITGSSVLSSGLSWSQTVAAFIVASAVTLVFLCLNAIPGAKHGIPFPVYARASFGIHGAQAVALTRGFVAIYWLSLQIWIGAKAIYFAFRELAPSTFANSPVLAHCGVSGAGDGDGDGSSDEDSDECLNLAELVFFLIVVGIHAAVIIGGIQRLTKALRLVAPVQIAACAALFLWAVTSVPIGRILEETKTFEKESTEATSLVFMTAVTAATSGWSTMCLNIADLSRYAKSQKAQVYGQCIGFPVTNVLTPSIGMLVAGAAKVLYKKDLWDLISLFKEWNGWVSQLAHINPPHPSHSSSHSFSHSTCARRLSLLSLPFSLPSLPP